jgi:hypothetical protein
MELKMHNFQGILVAGLLLLAGCPIAAQTEPRALLEKAIAAHGGERNLSNLQAGFSKAKGRLNIGEGLSFTQQTYYQLPDRLKEIEELEIQGKKTIITSLVNGDKVWLTVDGKNQDLDKNTSSELKEATYLLLVNRLIHLKKNSFRLSLLPQILANDKVAVGIKVASEGHKDVQLYFDKDRHLLVKLERQAVDVTSGKEVKEERFFSDYRAVNGLQEPQKVVIYRNGQKFLEGEVLEAKILEKLDPGIFEK